MPNPKEPVSFREAAKRFGVSPTLVANEMYDKKKNPGGCLRLSVGETKRGSKTQPILDWPVAYQEWLKAGKPVRNPEYYPRPAQDAAAELPKMAEQITENLIKSKPTKQGIDTDNTSAFSNIPENSIGFKSLLRPGMNPFEAEQVKALYEAGLKELAYLKLLGSVVPVDRVRSVLFNYGKTIKEAFLQIPARCAVEVRAANSDREAIDIMYKEIESVLSILAAGPSQSFTEDSTEYDDEEPIPKDGASSN